MRLREEREGGSLGSSGNETRKRFLRPKAARACARVVGLLLDGTLRAEKHALRGVVTVPAAAAAAATIPTRCFRPRSVWARIDLGKCYEPQHRLP